MSRKSELRTFIDLCSGVGSARVALQEAGLRCVGYSEIDNNAINLYSNFFDLSSDVALGDIFSINSSTLPNFDILIAGFPMTYIDKLRQHKFSETMLLSKVGNAMTVNVINAIIEQLKFVLNAKEKVYEICSI